MGYIFHNSWSDSRWNDSGYNVMIFARDGNQVTIEPDADKEGYMKIVFFDSYTAERWICMVEEKDLMEELSDAGFQFL